MEDKAHAFIVEEIELRHLGEFLPARLVNAFRMLQLRTVGDVMECPDDELIALPNVGAMSLLVLQKFREELRTQPERALQAQVRSIEEEQQQQQAQRPQQRRRKERRRALEQLSPHETHFAEERSPATIESRRVFMEMLEAADARLGPFAVIARAEALWRTFGLRERELDEDTLRYFEFVMSCLGHHSIMREDVPYSLYLGPPIDNTIRFRNLRREIRSFLNSCHKPASAAEIYSVVGLSADIPGMLLEHVQEMLSLPGECDIRIREGLPRYSNPADGLGKGLLR